MAIKLSLFCVIVASVKFQYYGYCWSTVCLRIYIITRNSRTMTVSCYPRPGFTGYTINLVTPLCSVSAHAQIERIVLGTKYNNSPDSCIQLRT